jgi:hypothetical protein
MERYFFFNSAPGDTRSYQAADFANYFGNVLSTGLLHKDNVPALQVKCEGTDLRTYVEPGKAIMQGYAYENTENLYLQHALPEPTFDRIDRIVLRLDKRNQSRYIKLFVKQGEPSETPVPPELQRDDFIYELSLAQIRVRANTSTLNPNDLVDERLDDDLCGLAHSLISIPTSQFQEQWENWFDTSSASFEQQFNDWFAGIKDSGFASQEEFNAHLAETASKFTSLNVNMIDMAVELETLKGATLNGVTANIFIETFQNLNDINLMNGIYDSTNKRLVL